MEGEPDLYVKSSEPLTKSQDRSSHHNSLSDASVSRSTPNQRHRNVRELLHNWKLLVIILTPILLLPIIIAIPNNPISRCAYILLLMAIYWCTEALPLPATALMPMFLAPMLGVMSSKNIAINYLADLNFLFVGGLMFAVAIEKWNLHKRIALGVLILIGTKPKMLLLGFISVTGFLSMWLSNTATTAMMIPIAHAVLVEMWKQKKTEGTVHGSDKYEMRAESEVTPVDREEQTLSKTKEEVIEPKDMSPEFQNLGKAVSLCVCYAANIGGTGTLTGTGPNLIIGKVMTKYFPGSNDITFGSWILFSAPLMILCLTICWLVLVLVFLGPRSLLCCKANNADDTYATEGGRVVLRREYRKLGNVRFAEVVLMVFFFILVMLWLWRDPKFTTGWSAAFKTGYVSDASTGLFICAILFAFPSSFPCLKSHTTGYKFGPAILDWQTVQRKLPWGVIILLGGGFALADMCKTSGLSDWLGCQLGTFDTIPKAALVFICGIVMTLFTEFTSNTSSASIFLPILAQLSVSLGIHPLYILIPVTICSSYAFAFPVATPPNAIVFAFGYLRVIDMVKSGMLMNLLCLLSVMMAINTYGAEFFSLQTMPPWVNSTALTNSC